MIKTLTDFRFNLSRRLVALFMSLFFISIVVSTLLIRTAVETTLISQDTHMMEAQMAYIDSLIGDHQIPAGSLTKYAQLLGVRITVIKLDGKVVYDSHHNPLTMVNHSDRKEVREAIRGLTGVNRHFSQTLHQDMLYVAKKLHKRIIRLSVKMERIESQADPIILKLIIIQGIIGLLIIVVIYRQAFRITRPLRQLVSSVERFAIDEQIPMPMEQGHDEVIMLANSFERLLSVIRKNLQDLKRLENYRREFIANASHELKTPITTIGGFLETLEGGAIDDPRYRDRFLKIIRENVNRLNSLVNDILKLAEIEGQRAFTEKVDATEVLNKLSMVQYSENTRLVWNVTKEALCVQSSSGELFSAFLNYIDNALKYSNDGKITIKLARDSNTLYFEVSDEGPGIPEEHLPRLFERFYRTDKNRSRATGGTGLGLSIVKHVVEKSGGQVGVHSAPGQGSRFYFTIPLMEN